MYRALACLFLACALARGADAQPQNAERNGVAKDTPGNDEVIS
ncbi:MAG: hypothetical protein NTW87_07665 [Planctomycetota bacterium]|nr:hypothetical protein [Planctomycetota bacterium]